MKKFIYQVAGWEFVDSEAFGKAWKEAKAKASEIGSPIYRLVVKGETVSQEVFLKVGCFLRVDLAKPEDFKVF